MTVNPFPVGLKRPDKWRSTEKAGTFKFNSSIRAGKWGGTRKTVEAEQAWYPSDVTTIPSQDDTAVLTKGGKRNEKTPERTRIRAAAGQGGLKALGLMGAVVKKAGA